MIERHFGESGRLSIGIEEELMILDAETLALSPAVESILSAADGIPLGGRLKTELHASVVESATEVCATVADARTALIALRRTAAEAAERAELRIAAAGSHPFSRPEDQAIAPDERYRAFVEYAGSSARRQGVNGLHVHVAMPSADACFHALEGVLPWLPVVLALSANSPYLGGEETELASNRAEVLSLLPRRGAPPPFRGYAEWERFVEGVVATGIVHDYTSIWWDVRPHPRFGTLEIRIPDQPTSPELSAALAALLQALCASVLERPRVEATAASRAIYDQNRWAAARFGPRAVLVHPGGDRAVTVPEALDELGAAAGAAAGDLGTDGFLGALDGTRCEADRQREVGRAHGLRAVCADLVERSLASAACPSAPRRSTSPGSAASGA